MGTTEGHSDPYARQSCTDNSKRPPLTAGQRLDRVCSSAREAWADGNRTVRDFNHALDISGRLDRNPYGLVSIAAGVGYVLGGGIFSPLTARIVGLSLQLGLRLAAVPFIQRELLGIAQAACQRDSDDLDKNPNSEG